MELIGCVALVQDNQEPVGYTPGSSLGSLFLPRARMLLYFLFILSFINQITGQSPTGNVRRRILSCQCDSHAIPHSHRGIAFFLFYSIYYGLIWILGRRASLGAWHRTQIVLNHLDQNSNQYILHIITLIISFLNNITRRLRANQILFIIRRLYQILIEIIYYFRSLSR